MTREELLNLFHESGALLEGHFELRSGLHSNQFFQCALVLRYPDLAEKLCRAVVEKMKRATGGEPACDGVISPAIGGIPVGHEVGRALGTRAIFAEKKNDGLVLRRGFTIRPGERFVIAEDVVTRGGRVQQTIDIVEAHGGIAAAGVVLVDRSGGKASFTCPHYSLLEIEPVTYDPADCPLCAAGRPLVHPGS